jgi:tetratricopeptide (TPR) repeat protein
VRVSWKKRVPLASVAAAPNGRGQNTRVAICVFSLLWGTSVAQNSAPQPKQPDSLQQHYQAAEKYQAADDEEHAAQEYQAFLADALHRVANGRAQMGEFELAFALFDQATAFAPHDANLILDYAAASLSADKLQKSEALAEKAVALAPRDSHTHLLLGRILFHLANYPAAKTQLEVALVGNSDFQTGYLLGRTYLLLKDEESARILFDEMIAGLGDNALIHMYLGRAYSANDYRDQALAEFQKAIAKDPLALGVHYYLGLSYLRHNEEAGYDKAVPEFHAELKNNPDDFSSHYMLGYIALQQRNLPDAEAELTRAIALKPQDANALLHLAKVYSDTERLAESEATLRRVIAVSDPAPDYRAGVSRAHYMLGQLLQRTGRQEEGQKELRTFSEMERELRGSLGVNADVRNIGADNLARDETQADDKATKHSSPEEVGRFEEFVKRLSPAMASAYNSLGGMAAAHQDFAGAVIYFRKATDWDPALDGIDRNLGVASFYAGQYDQAAVWLAHFLQSRPADDLARSTLALTHFQLKNFAQVIETLRPNPRLADADTKVSYAYAIALVKTGQTAAGIERLKTLDQALPNSPQIRAALAEAQAVADTDSPRK